MADEVKLKPTPINPIEIKGAIAFSAEHARVWAEGADSEVEKLGGEHSAKGWADVVAEGNKDYTDQAVEQAKSQVIGQLSADIQTNSTQDRAYALGLVQTETTLREQADSAETDAREAADSSLQTQINNLKDRGRFLALWNCATGLAETQPATSPYSYKSGDYFIVGTVASAGGTNYKPNGSSYSSDVPSTTVETATVVSGDCYYYDGTTWALQVNTQRTVSFANIAGDPYDNSELASDLNAKQNTIADLSDIRSGAAAGATALQPDTAASTYLSQTDAADTYATKTSLATVATSGSYNDLSNKPTIPTVNNSTITLTQGGTTKGYFTLNQSSDATIALDAGGSDLPSQTGHSGEFLTTDGTDASWAPISIPSAVWTQENLIAGENTTITKVQQPVYGDTLGLWHLNDATTDEVYGNNLVTGSGSFVSGGKFSNFAFQNSYGNSYIDIGELLDNESSFTIDWWFFWPGSHNTIFFTTEDQSVPGSGAGLRNISWGHSTAGTIMYFNNKENKQYPTSIVNGWNHVALCVNLTQGKAYYIINGQTYNEASIPSGSALYGKTSFGNLCRRICVFADTKSSEIRLSKGLVWTQSDVPFTPPSAPYVVPETEDIYQINATKYEGPSLTWYTGNTGTSVTIADTTGANLVKVYKNGVLLQHTGDYSVSGTTLTLVTALESTDKIAVEVF